MRKHFSVAVSHCRCQLGAESGQHRMSVAAPLTQHAENAAVDQSEVTLLICTRTALQV